MNSWFRVVPAIVLVAACGGEDGGAPADVRGRIELEEAELGGAVGAVASIYASFEAPGAPDLVNDGSCRVYPRACLGQVGACGSPPEYSAGTITIDGLTVPVRLEPDAESHFYGSPIGLPDELFADAAAVHARAGGDQVAGFDVAVGGVAPLASPYVDASLGLVPGEALALAWTAVAGDARVALEVNWASICHAGADWYVLACDVPDRGAFTVPAAITSALPAGAGFGPCGARLARVRRATVPGRDIAITVASADYFGFF